MVDVLSPIPIHIWQSLMVLLSFVLYCWYLPFSCHVLLNKLIQSAVHTCISVRTCSHICTAACKLKHLRTASSFSGVLQILCAHARLLCLCCRHSFLIFLLCLLICTKRISWCWRNKVFRSKIKGVSVSGIQQWVYSLVGHVIIFRFH